MSPPSPPLLPVFSQAILSRMALPERQALARDTCPFFVLMQRARVIATNFHDDLQVERLQNRALELENQNLDERLAQTRLTVEVQERELRQTKDSLANALECYTQAEEQLATKNMLESRVAALEPMLQRANTRKLPIFSFCLSV